MKTNTANIKKIIDGQQQVQDLEVFFKKSNELNANQIMQKVMEVIKDQRQNVLTRDDFLDVRNEIGAMITDISALKSYKDDYKQRHIELEDKVYGMLRETESALIKQGEMIAALTQFDTKLDGKVENERFEDET